jgi:hypothetical protein
VPGSRVEFRGRLGEIYDWSVVGDPTEELLELVNVNAGCRVRDETAPYTGEADDDETASRALVLGLLGDGEVLGGPRRSAAGIGEGLGEGAPMYDVMHALAVDPKGGYVYVTGRVFAALGVQHAVTVRCELGGYLDRTRGQIAGATWVVLDLPEPPPGPAVSASACTRDDLVISYTPFDESPTQLVGVLEMRNDSSAACSASGYPVLFFSSPGQGETWGPRAAPDDSRPPSPVDLRPGLSATAIVTISRADRVCADTLATSGFVVAPPTDAFDAKRDGRYVAVPGLQVCADQTVQLLAVESLWS